MTINSKPAHGVKVVEDDIPTRPLQNFFDDLDILLNARLLGQAVILPSYTVSALPNASKNKGGMIVVSDESGGFVTAFSDGANWRRTTDRIVVS